MDIVRIKKLLKNLGISTDMLLVPYYLAPYNLFNGYAFAPLRIVFEITFRCNLECQMCPLANWKNQDNDNNLASPLKKELNTREIKNFIDESRLLKTKAIMITGGEPFIRQDLLEVLDYIKRKEIYCSVITNGTLISEDAAKQLVKIGNEVISFSVDGPKDIHNSIRGKGDSFSGIYNAIDKIQSFKNGGIHPKINLNFTISALNQGNLDKIVDVAHDLKINFINFLYLFYTTEETLKLTSKVLNTEELKPEDQNIADEIKQIDINVLNESIRKAQNKAKLYNITLNFRPPLNEYEIEKRFFNPRFSYCSKCFYPWIETRIDPYGNIYPCSIDVLMGNLRENSLREIWNASKYRNFRKLLKKYKLLPACTKCCKLNSKFWSYLPTF